MAAHANAMVVSLAPIAALCRPAMSTFIAMGMPHPSLRVQMDAYATA
jgi:hypothetical protein